MFKSKTLKALTLKADIKSKNYQETVVSLGLRLRCIKISSGMDLFAYYNGRLPLGSSHCQR